VIEVALIEDDRAMREGLALLIGSSKGFCCTQSFGSVEEALRDRPAVAPDVILLDINLPGTSGADGVPALLQKHPRASVLMLTVFDEQEHIFTSICNGASGYLLKKTPTDQILAAIRDVREGGVPMSREIARKVLQVLRGARPAPPPAHALTPKEVRVLALLSDGHGYQSAAEQLGISIDTIRNYIRQIYQVLQVHSKSAAVSKAIRRRII